MKHDELSRVEHLLRGVPSGGMAVIRSSAPAQNCTLLADQFPAKINGKGKVEVYTVFPGMEASYNIFLAPEVTFHHEAFPSVLEIFYCQSGRAGWNMQNGTAVYLGAGDLTAHNAVCCADSAMMFPLGYAEGILISIDLQCLAKDCPEILREAGLDLKRLQALFGSEEPVVIPACPKLNSIFEPLYSVDFALRMPYLKLKLQELLLYLNHFQPDRKESTQYYSRQTELVKEIHQMLTEHLDQRFTIEELSRQYLINTSTLKEIFKSIYGLPIATYMKEYRVRRAMELLRETDASISDISARVGYETQGKFSKAFKDIAQIVPTEYRKKYRRQS